MIIKGRGSVTMPKLPKAIGNLLGYAREVNQALQQLADRAFEIPSQPNQKPYRHPLKIYIDNVGSETRCTLEYANVINNTWRATSGGDAQYQLFNDYITINTTGTLRNDPFAVTPESYIVLSRSATHGIWLELTIISDSSVSDNFGDFGTMNPKIWAAEVISSTTYLEPQDSLSFTYAQNNGKSYLCVGKVVVSSDGTPTITQNLRSDLVLPGISIPSGFVSAKADNSLTSVGATNPGLWVRVVSGDSSNSITEGSDGGAYYDAPPVVSADANNSITTGTDGGPFYDAP